MEAKAVEEKIYAMEKSLGKKLVAIFLFGDDGGDEATHTTATESTRKLKIKNHFRLHLCTIKRPLSFYCNLCEDRFRNCSIGTSSKNEDRPISSMKVPESILYEVLNEGSESNGLRFTSLENGEAPKQKEMCEGLTLKSMKSTIQISFSVHSGSTYILKVPFKSFHLNIINLTELHKGTKLCNLCLQSDGYYRFPTLLSADGASNIDRVDEFGSKIVNFVVVLKNDCDAGEGDADRNGNADDRDIIENVDNAYHEVEDGNADDGEGNGNADDGEVNGEEHGVENNGHDGLLEAGENWVEVFRVTPDHVQHFLGNLDKAQWHEPADVLNAVHAILAQEDSQLQIVMNAKMLATPLGMKEMVRFPRHRVLADFGGANPQNQNIMDIDGIQGEEGQHGNGEEGGDGHGEGGQNEDDQEEESEDELEDDNALDVWEVEHAEGRISARHYIGQVPSESITGPVALHHVLKEMLAERVPEAQLPLWNIVCWSVRENGRERKLLCPNLTMPMIDFNRLLHGADFVRIPYEDLYIFEEQGQALIIERLKEDGETLLLEECFATIIPGTYETAERFEEAVKAAVHRCWVQYPQLANQPVDLLPDNYQLLYYTRLTDSEMREISISMEWDLFRSLLWGAFVCDRDPPIDLFKLQDAEVPLLQYWEDGN